MTRPRDPDRHGVDDLLEGVEGLLAEAAERAQHVHDAGMSAPYARLVRGEIGHRQYVAELAKLSGAECRAARADIRAERDTAALLEQQQRLYEEYRAAQNRVMARRHSTPRSEWQTAVAVMMSVSWRLLLVPALLSFAFGLAAFTMLDAAVDLGGATLWLFWGIAAAVVVAPYLLLSGRRSAGWDSDELETFTVDRLEPPPLRRAPSSRRHWRW